MPNLHRNNAAEWIMVWASAPFKFVKWLFRKRTSALAPPAPAKPKRSVMIEGLPPRTMN